MTATILRWEEVEGANPKQNTLPKDALKDTWHYSLESSPEGSSQNGEKLCGLHFSGKHRELWDDQMVLEL